MGTLLLAGVVFVTAATDTTVAVQRGDRVRVASISGEMQVRVWDRSELSVRGNDNDVASVRVSRSGGELTITTDARSRRRRHDFTLWLPSWIDLDVRGGELEVDVTGLAGSLEISTLDGEVQISGTTGPVTVRTVEGEIGVRRATGRIFARSQGDDIRVEDSRGASLEVESGSGDIALLDVDFENLRAETIDGDVHFDGELRRGGSYAFSVHDGDVVLSLSRDVGARVSVATFDGEFMSEFPVTVQGFSGGRAFDFVLGEGGAELELEVFDGEIHLLARR